MIIDGRITPENTGQKQIDIKRVKNLTIQGQLGGAEFSGIGIKITDSQNIILRNLIIHHVDIGAKDALGIEGDSHHIWVDHNEFFASLAVHEDYYDRLFDTKRGARNITVSYNYFHDSWKASLHGSSDSDWGERKITFHHNRFENINSRAPLFRFGIGHVFNNYYLNVQDSGINSRMDAKLRVEQNVFEQSHNPIVSFYSDRVGYWDLRNNLLDGVSWKASSDGEIAGEAMKSTTSVELPYRYYMDPSHCVREMVLAAAGAGKGLVRSDGQCNLVPDGSTNPPEPPTPPNPEPPNDGDNLALNAGSDGSSEQSGSSYSNVRDGDLNSFWMPRSATQESISIKRMQPFNKIIIRERNFATRSWRLIDESNQVTLAAGEQLGPETVIQGLPLLSIDKVTLAIDHASKLVQIAEFELYHSTASDTMKWLPKEAMLCSSEHQFCAFEGVKTVYYGAADRYYIQIHRDGVHCNNQVFGDPLFGTIKSCFVLP
ncbi:pectate lyase family protein [Pleionea litopenaei]|uniref:Pectate lyase domain-containing protein n=1 Tax=Pleionea litopenaei TaxID=3070815 RepID=A0AA51RX37_9GAMM|nr:hypothetical protein [Pleionea sp. HL-JVS1]WMS89207.1 hypothetical protein Q9312_05050 [Pleionea sp. HL-JVS1]